MRPGRCAQIIHQRRQRVESNLFDVAVLSILLMTDSRTDEAQGTAEGEKGKGLMDALVFQVVGEGDGGAAKP